ncbi:FAM151A/B family protein [Myxococcus sp. CA040A]|nr:DUF2181 domain-containing protein [Myxococcus sp. CA040A]NTX04653.1 DUF2181 domain-containing protein [Myxococcus sp. CA040A]
MSFGFLNRIRRKVVAWPKPPPPPPPPPPKTKSAGEPTGYSQVDSFQAPRGARTVERASAPGNTWSGDRPLSEARNAHRTNTKEEFQSALQSDANWFEGDVRKELNHDSLEMRHDTTHESGDNLSLHEWLSMGKESGRGLKLDIKEGEHMGAVLDEIERVGVPQERLMLNLGFGDVKTWGDEIRTRFPNAILAINPPPGDGTVRAADARQMVDEARRAGGGPTTFVVHHDALSDEAIEVFKTAGTVSVWGNAEDPTKVAAEMRARGVDGMVDIGSNYNWGSLSRADGVRDGLDAGKNWARTRWDRLF